MALVRVLQKLWPESCKEELPEVVTDVADTPQIEEPNKDPTPSPEKRSRRNNSTATMEHMQDAADDSSDDEDYVDGSDSLDSVSNQLDDVAKIGEQVALSNLPKWTLVALAFDAAFELIDQIDKEHGEDPNSIEQQAVKVRELAIEANEALIRLQKKALFSQYQMISEETFPYMIRKWGSRVQRANEQGQEQLGQLLKRIIKYGVNKRRKAGSYLRLGKLCQYTATATKQGLEKPIQKLQVANKSNHKGKNLMILQNTYLLNLSKSI